MITRGAIVASGTPSDLKRHVAELTVVEIETYGATADAIERIRAVPGVSNVVVEEREQAQVLHVSSPSGLQLTSELLRQLDGTTVGRVAAREPTLEDAYVALVKSA